MENKELKFKTTLNCGGCVAKVKSDFDNADGISAWQVDTENADKILTVQSRGTTQDEIIQIVKSKGFSIAAID